MAAELQVFSRSDASEHRYFYSKSIVERMKLIERVDAVVTFKKGNGPMSSNEIKECDALGKKLSEFHDLMATGKVMNLTVPLVNLSSARRAFMDSHPGFAIEDWNTNCRE